MSYSKPQPETQLYDKNYRESNKVRKQKFSRTPQFSCEQLCGRVTPCGNRYCSNYRGPKKK